MIIHVEDLKFQCIIGILDFERTTLQDVIVNAKIEYEYKNDYINYVEIVDIIKYQMQNREFLLIEDALKFIIDEIILKYKDIKNIDLKITKPSILDDCKVSVSYKYKCQS